MSGHWGAAIPAFGLVKHWRGYSAAGTPTYTLDPKDVAARYAGYSTKGVTVLVWEPRDGIGHASLVLSPTPGIYDDISYVSLFPGDDVDTGESGAGAEHIRPGRMLTAEWMNYAGDCKSEGDRTRYRLPEFEKTITGLDTVKMVAEWLRMRDKEHAHYRLVRKNCATIVARVLRAGMSRSQHAKALLVAHKLWWSPYDVKVLADTI